MICLLSDSFIVNVYKECLLIFFFKDLPFIQGMPHQVPVGHFLSQLVDVIEDRSNCPELLLPLVVFQPSVFKFFELCELFIKLLDHLTHVGLVIQVVRNNALISESLDLRLEDRDHLFEVFFESLIFLLLL